MKNTKISVIIPVYNVEKEIMRCAQSLFVQTLHSSEFIFIDDASPDNSIEILKECINKYSERKKQIKIVRHDINKGLPAARNTGLKEAKGEYIFHCDSDDYLEPTALEGMYNATQQGKYDVVWCDWFLSFNQNERYMKQPCYSDSICAVKGMLGGAMKYNVWNKLIKRTLYVKNNILFPEGYSMGEDMTTIKLMACANQVAYLPRAYYHYWKGNEGSFTNTKEKQQEHITQVQHNISEVEAFLLNKYGTALCKEVNFLKLNMKYPLIISPNSSSYEQWLKLYPEANKYIKLNKYITQRARILQLAAKKRMFWLLKLHYYVCYKLIYGVLYY